MQKFIRILSIVLLVASGIMLPFVFMAMLLGLAGSTAGYYKLMLISYMAFMLFCLVSIFRYKAFVLVIVSFIALSAGVGLDSMYWKRHNQRLCEELRAEPTCIEDDCGFDCSDLDGSSFSTSGSICDGKVVNCDGKLEGLRSIDDEGWRALRTFGDIVDSIIASPSPATEDFEDQLMAIHNCLQSKLGSPEKAERRAVESLVNMRLKKSQLSKYYEYLSSKGRPLIGKKIAARLPSGNKSLSCGDIKYYRKD